jgi:hypothetical protein
VTRRRLHQILPVAVLVALVALTLAPTAAGARVPSRYFEVKFIASGTFNSAPVCTAEAPCEGHNLTGHDMGWGWIAYALVVATQTGSHTMLHLIGPEPRVAGYFTEKVSWSRRDDCNANVTTGGGLAAFMASRMRFDDRDGRLSVDVGAPLDRHFAVCGLGTVSNHGRDDTLASWDGLKGPWDYKDVRGPTRGEIRRKRVIVDVAYNAGLGISHPKDGWLHTSCCGSNLTLVFTRFSGGQNNVLAYERKFVRKHPVTSHGLEPYDVLHPTPTPLGG